MQSIFRKEIELIAKDICDCYEHDCNSCPHFRPPFNTCDVYSLALAFYKVGYRVKNQGDTVDVPQSS